MDTASTLALVSQDGERVCTAATRCESGSRDEAKASGLGSELALCHPVEYLKHNPVRHERGDLPRAVIRW